MKLFAIVVFVAHTVMELAFGASAYLAGASSSQSAAEIAQQSTELTIAFRFMGSALFALGLLGALALFAGVASRAARLLAFGFAAFHGLGVLGSLWSAAPSFAVYSEPLILGGVFTHSFLAIGFAIIALTHPVFFKETRISAAPATG